MQICFKLQQCKTTWASGFHKPLKQIQGMKRTKIFKIIPIPSISKEYIIPRLHKLCDIRRAHFMKAGLFLYKKLQKLQENKIEN